MLRSAHLALTSGLKFSTGQSLRALSIPYNGGLPFVGTSLAIVAAGGAPKLHEYVDFRHKESGPIFRENLGDVTALFVSDPSLMRKVFSVEGKFPKHFVPKAWTLYNDLHKCKRGLFFMEGEEWYKYRRVMNKYFLSTKSLKDLETLHENLVVHLIDRWKRFDGQEVPNLEYEFYRHSISFVLGSLIGNSYWHKFSEYSPYVDELARKFQFVFDTSSKLNVLPSVKLVQFLGLRIWKNFESAVSASLDASRNVVRKALGDLSEEGFLYKLADDKIPEDVTSALVADLLMAAGDTTAFTSQWAVYLLGRDRLVQDAVRRDTSLVRGVVRETLRLYPSAAFIARVLPEAESIDGYDLKKEELVLLSLYTSGRDDRLYPSADKFIPERWIKEGTRRYKGVKNVNSFLPFAMGARSCIGARLANAQLTMTITQILKNFHLETLEKTDMVLRLVPVPSKPIRLKIQCRDG